MERCPRCSLTVSSQSKYCPWCGALISLEKDDFDYVAYNYTNFISLLIKNKRAEIKEFSNKISERNRKRLPLIYYYYQKKKKLKDYILEQEDRSDKITLLLIGIIWARVFKNSYKAKQILDKLEKGNDYKILLDISDAYFNIKCIYNYDQSVNLIYKAATLIMKSKEILECAEAAFTIKENVLGKLCLDKAISCAENNEELLDCANINYAFRNDSALSYNILNKIQNESIDERELCICALFWKKMFNDQKKMEDSLNKAYYSEITPDTLFWCAEMLKKTFHNSITAKKFLIKSEKYLKTIKEHLSCAFEWKLLFDDNSKQNMYLNNAIEMAVSIDDYLLCVYWCRPNKNKIRKALYLALTKCEITETKEFDELAFAWLNELGDKQFVKKTLRKWEKSLNNFEDIYNIVEWHLRIEKNSPSANALVRKYENLCEMWGDYLIIARCYALLGNYEQAKYLLTRSEKKIFNTLEMIKLAYWSNDIFGNKKEVYELVKKAEELCSKKYEWNICAHFYESILNDEIEADRCRRKGISA